ncbi:sterigmatocystin 8-O-methyltransferase [Periconia macrospinosa]|uniref:Sterigmatocystin 8-O-methyltransferase n=1 Tax=Periconia macrospinosa TaxID=97972 RepID=A0A2V1D7N1_9PLEO|nr:sterigmatocystin 8-O-methyltransferase [Periconia macrospinosa]
MPGARNIIEALSSLAQKPDFEDDADALALAAQLAKQLELSTKKPEDAAIELCFHPSFAATVRVAINLKLFHHIAIADSTITAHKLSEVSGCPENLLIRILRPISALGFVEEAGENVWSATPITKAMCIPSVEATHIHCWDQGTMAAVKMPLYFEEKGYQQPEDPRNGLFQYAFNTKKEAFELWATQPEVISNFNTCMTGIRGSRTSWVEWYPVEERLLNADLRGGDSDVTLVDIAGGRGHDVQAFGRKFPSSKGRLVLQDLPSVIADIQELDGRVERVAHDFFTPQPIIGARVYFFHFIMHDWSDNVCGDILSKIVAAMEPGYSKLILNEFILPNRGSPLFSTGFDLQMMTMHAAQERTETQWERLLERVGLKLVKFWIPPGGGEGIIEAEIPTE